MHPGETFRDPDDLSFPEIPAREPRRPLSADAPVPPPGALPPRPADKSSPTGKQAERSRGSAAATPAHHYAGFAIRSVAFLIDAAILGSFALPLALAGFAGVKIGLLATGTPAPLGVEEALTSLFPVGWLAMATGYFTALHSGTGQTIGKALLGIRVRSMDFGAIGTTRSFIRSLGYFASSTFFGLGFLMVALTPRKRGWHDYLAGTCVVHLAPAEL